MTEESPVDTREIRATLAGVEAARWQVRVELSRGRRPWWFIAACAVTVGAATAGAALPQRDAWPVLAAVPAGMVALAIVERRVVPLMPHWRRFTAGSVGVALGVSGLVVTVAIASRLLFDALGLPAPSVGSGATAALAVAALARPSLRWLGASLRGDDR